VFPESIGLVKTEFFNIPTAITLESGDTLKNATIAYETYGTLNSDKSNAILLCHALSGDAHVAGYHENAVKPGWWEIMVGPGKAIDTDRFFIICSNIIGSCLGSSGPSSMDPATQKPYALTFPLVTIGDMVKAQKLLVDFFCTGYCLQRGCPSIDNGRPKLEQWQLLRRQKTRSWPCRGQNDRPHHLPF
jgi:homoserine O-acetyltransferase